MPCDVVTAGLASALMTPPRNRPPFVADERTQLVGWLDLQRALVAWKCEGLSEAQAHRSVLATSPLMTMAGIVSHLRWAEHCWFEVLFMGRPADGPLFNGPEDADFMAADRPLAQLIDDYQRQCAVSSQIIAAHSLRDVGRHPDFDSAAATLRWMLIHMVEDTIRELLDGTKGYY